MKLDTERVDNYVDQNLLKKHRFTIESSELWQLCYKQKTVYDRRWDDLTKKCRGIIIEPDGTVIAQPFDKFFNLNESGIDEVKFENVMERGEPSCVMEKLDGSLGIAYHYKGEWRFNTKASHNSEQARWAKNYFDQNVEASFDQSYTHMFEIIYPSNRIVVDYGDTEGLFLIGMRKPGNQPLPYDEMKDYAEEVGYDDIVESKPYDTLRSLRNRKDEIEGIEQEGYVVEWEDGFRLKLKAEEYLEYHRIMTELTPLHMWRLMEDGKVPEEYIKEVPEEFRDLCDEIRTKLEEKYRSLENKLINQFQLLGLRSYDSRKEQAKKIQEEVDEENYGAMFALLDGESIEDLVMKRIRPDENKIDGKDYNLLL